MSESGKQQPINQKVVEVLVESVFRKNGVKTSELKNNLSAEQKQMIKEMVDDLKEQVNEFAKNGTEESEE